MKNLSRSCPICSETRGDVLHRQEFCVFEDYPLPASYDVVSCVKCGMVYADTPAPQSHYDEFYAACSIYQHPAESSAGSTPAWDLARLEEAANIYEPLIPSPDSRILDVGCANGGLLQALRRRGFRSLAGVDLSPACVENTRHHGFTAHCGASGRLPFALRRFDVVILTAVLEHIVDVKGAIDSVVDSCAENGKLIIEVPDAARYADFVHAPLQEFNTEHINHFSRASLLNLMGQFGFSPILEKSWTMKGPSGLDFPCLDVAYQRTAGVVHTGEWAVESGFVASIQRYIDLSTEQMKRLDRQLRDALSSSPQVILWATGQLAMKLLCDTSLKDAGILACVDGNQVNHGRTLRGARVLAPDELRSSGTPILITTLLHEPEIRARIGSLGLTNPVISLHL